jgi:serine protease AprX
MSVCPGVIVNLKSWDVVWRSMAVVVLGTLGAGTAEAQRKAPVDRGVAAARARGDAVQVIIRTDPRSLPVVSAALTQRGVAPRDLPQAAAISADLSPAHLEAVLQMEGVEGVSLDAPLVASGSTKKSTSRTTTSDLTTTDGSADGTAAWTEWWTSAEQSAVLKGTLGLSSYGPTGKGVGVAIIDSGIDGNAAAFAGRITAFYDFTRGGRKATPTDDYGHGTHVAGLIGAATDVFRGIAPAVDLIGLKVLDAEGRGQTSDVIAALDFVTANRARLNVHVVNLSLGHPILEPAATDPLVQAVERASAAGLVVVVSAGNFGQHPDTGVSGYAGITSPGNAPSALTVGSLDMRGTWDRGDDTVSEFSSRGPTWYDAHVKPDVVAPGHGLFAVSATSSTLEDSASASAAGTAIKLFGTSMAAATTSGVVALVLESNRSVFDSAGRDLPPNAVKALLQFTSVALVDSRTQAEADLLTEGAGGLNAAGAIALARALDPGVAVGAWWLATTATESSYLGGHLWPWTRRIIWGDTLLYGHAVYANAPAWQQDIVWGDALVWGETLVWGEALVWGDTLVWGQNVVTSTALVWGDSIVWGEGLVDIDGQTIIWGDSLVWGEALVWGDTLVWGTGVAPQ